MTTLSIIDKGLHLASRRSGGSWTPFSFAMRIMAKLLWTSLCLFEAIVELHAMDEKNAQ